MEIDVLSELIKSALQEVASLIQRTHLLQQFMAISTDYILLFRNKDSKYAGWYAKYSQ
jgi:hypothetical protein